MQRDGRMRNLFFDLIILFTNHSIVIILIYNHMVDAKMFLFRFIRSTIFFMQNTKFVTLRVGQTVSR